MRRLTFKIRRLVAQVGLALVCGPAAAGELPPGFEVPAIDAPAGRPIIVAIVDDGFRLDHVELKPFWSVNPREIPGNGVDDDHNGRVDDALGWDIADGDADVQPAADRLGVQDHGTHLASVVARVARAAWGDRAPELLRIVPIKAMSDAGEHPILVGGYDGVAAAVALGADVVLTAWAVGHVDPGERNTLDAAVASGVLIIAAAGNMGSGEPQYPAAHPDVLSVAAAQSVDVSGHVGHRLPRSSWGSEVDLVAPGFEVAGADARTTDQARLLSGTSPAAALVAGLGAVLWREHPGWTRDTLVAALRTSAVTVAWDDERAAAGMGAGVVDPAAALTIDPWSHRGLWPRVVGDLPLARSRDATSFSIAAPGLVESLGLEVRTERGGASLGRTPIAVYAGRATDAPVVYDGPLSALPAGLRVPGGRAYVRVGPIHGRGRAWLRYRATSVDVARRYCSGTVTLDAPGSLEDGSGDAPYAPGSDCRWQITAPPGHVVRFRVDTLDTEPSVDQVLFFDGTTTADPLFAGLSGSEHAADLTSWGSQVLVWFVTNDVAQGAGWRLSWEFVPAP